MNLIKKEDQHGVVSDSSHSTLPSPMLSKLWMTFLEHVHRPTLTEEDVLATLSYCFNLPSTMTGQTRILFNTFLAAKLLLPEHNNGTHTNPSTAKDNQHTYVISSLLQDQVNGFLVGFAHCYAAGCKPTQPSCYAPTCPHKIYTQWLSVYNQHQQQHPQSHHIAEKDKQQTQQQDSWTGQVPRHILNTYPLREIKRQSAIAELLQSELDYCQDLTLLDQVYAQPFLTSTINLLETTTRRDKFYAIVFEHALGLKSYHQRICYELARHRQDPLLLFVDFVGTALLQHTSYLVEPYTSYAGRHVQAKYIFDNEKYRNPAFQRWVDTQDEDSRVRKLDIKHFLSRPTFRMAKYKLQLEAIAKYSDHMADQVALYAAIDSLQDLLHQMNESIRKAETRTHLLRITSSLVPTSTAASLGLLNLSPWSCITDSGDFNDGPDSDDYGGGDGSRGGDGHGPICLLHEGRFRLTRLSSHSLRAQACHVFLFSHALVLTKPRGQPGHEKYVLIGRPIPLPMLSVGTHRSSIMRRLSGRIITSQQCHHQQRFDHYQLANSINSGTGSNDTLSPSSKSSNGSWTTDLRHRFSVTSTTTTTSSTSSSSWSTDPSSSFSSPSTPSSPASSLSTSPTKPLFATGVTLSESPTSLNCAPKKRIYRSPTVTGLHVRARLIQRWQHLKRLHQTYPEPSPTIPAISPRRPTSQEPDHAYHQYHDKKVLLSPMTTSPSFSPFAFVKRKNSLFRSSSSLLGRRGSFLFSTKASSSPKDRSTGVPSPIQQLDGKELQPTGYQGQSRLTIRHLAYPEYTFGLQCRHLHQRDQWYEWIQKALEASAIRAISSSSSSSSAIHTNKNTGKGALDDTIKPPFRLGLICQVPVGSTNPINVNGDRKLPAGCGRIFCSLPFATVDGRQILALGTQHGLWVAARDGIGEEFLLIEMIECHQLATLDGHLVVRSHHTLKSYSLTQLTALMKKRQSHLSPPPPSKVSSPISPVSTASSGSSAYPFQPSSFSDGSSTGSSLTTASTAAEESPQACYPLSISSTTIKRSSVLDFVTGTLYGCPVLCYVGRTRQHRKLQKQQQHQHDPSDGGLCNNSTTHPWLDMVHLPANTYDDDDLALLCTNEAAWMINKRTMSFEERHSLFQFEANVKSVALIYPYLILFSTCIIEIRHLEVDEMVQVIPGYNIRCVYMSSPNDASQKSIIHFTMLHHPDERVSSVYQLVL
ncbi:hypothetical protein [Absidia glauca]|uniref:DH domain-containing protein n=1 Tax=Absidia glauca TaxID=4829 RepID=A0A168SY11_ABSGL|nr:hypothetical protein [Absidia glauca]